MVRVSDLQVVTDACRCPDLDVCVFAKKDAFVEVANVEHVQLVRLVDRFTADDTEQNIYCISMAKLSFSSFNLHTHFELARFQNAHHVLWVALQGLQATQTITTS